MKLKFTTAQNNIWFTSDTHIKHKKVLQLCNRPFQTIEEHDETIYKNINDVVQQDDLLFHLGDVSWGNVKEFKDKINCKHIKVIHGNHDSRQELNKVFGANNVFSLADIKVNDQFVTLCHYPMASWNKSHYGSWQLFGHHHSRFGVPIEALQMDVGVDCNNYKPFSWNDIVHRMNFKVGMLKKKLGIGKDDLLEEQWTHSPYE